MRTQKEGEFHVVASAAGSASDTVSQASPADAATVATSTKPLDGVARYEMSLSRQPVLEVRSASWKRVGAKPAVATHS